MRLPAHIAERIQKWVAATPKKGLHVDHEAARYGGVSLMGTLGSTWLMRPDGTLWEVDDDFKKPLQPLAAELHVTALVAGAERHAWLAELLPSRRDNARDCPSCGGEGKVWINRDSDQYVYCHPCSGLGWIAGVVSTQS